MDSIGRRCFSILEVPGIGMVGGDMDMLRVDDTMVVVVVDEEEKEEAEEEEDLRDGGLFSKAVSSRIAASFSTSFLCDNCLVFFV